MEANSNDYSYSLHSLEVEYTQLNDILDELCYHSLFFPHERPSGLNFYFVNNAVHSRNQERIIELCKIMVELNDSLIDKMEIHVTFFHKLLFRFI